MKSAYITALVLGLLTTPVLAEVKTKEATRDQKLSYSAGYRFGLNIQRQGIPVSQEYLMQGMQDAMTGSESVFSQEELVAAVESWEKEAKEQKQMAATENLKQGEAFLAENGKKEGVVTLENGLQYKIINEGEGASPKASDQVTVHYRGTLIDGTEFDSSYKRGEPTTFGVSQVIQGWVQALQMMKEGAKWELAIPANLAYGERGAGGVIGPNQTLLFEVELIKIGG